MDQIYRVFDKRVNAKLLLLLFGLTGICMFGINLVDFSISVPRINSLSGGVGILDTKFYYSEGEVYRVLDALQINGRQTYLQFLLFFDMIFPLLFSITFSAVIIKIFSKAFSGMSWIHNLYIVPFIAAMFDYLENASIITILLKYPEHIWIANIVGYFTACKWLISWLGLGLILFGLVRRLLCRLSEKVA